MNAYHVRGGVDDDDKVKARGRVTPEAAGRGHVIGCGGVFVYALIMVAFFGMMGIEQAL